MEVAVLRVGLCIQNLPGEGPGPLHVLAEPSAPVTCRACYSSSVTPQCAALDTGGAGGRMLRQGGGRAEFNACGWNSENLLQAWPAWAISCFKLSSGSPLS